MTGKEFMNKLANGKDDFLQAFVDIINRNKIPTCIIGGLAVNAYVEPVVSLDLDIVVVSTKIKELMGILKDKYHIENYPNSINVSEKTSDLRIQIQTDPRYQDFLERAKEKDVLGYKLLTASIEDVLMGKIWAATDKQRRGSKRQKDLADIMRLIEAQDGLISLLPEELKERLYPDK